MTAALAESGNDVLYVTPTAEPAKATRERILRHTRGAWPKGLRVVSLTESVTELEPLNVSSDARQALEKRIRQIEHEFPGLALLPRPPAAETDTAPVERPRRGPDAADG